MSERLASSKRRKVIAFAGLALLLFLAAGLAGTVYITSSPAALRRTEAWWRGAKYLGTEGVTMQTMPNNCGPASLKMIFDHYEIPSTISEIDRRVGLTTRGSSMLSLKEMAEAKGLGADGWIYTIKDFVKAPMPAIVFVRGDHFVVADSVTPYGDIFLSDPALGRIEMTLGNFRKIWNGQTLIFKTSDNGIGNKRR
ncbi:MAG: cysteine peptidase family C39 domain-containing protein [Bacteroidetes bacterium]|nr:cysteine peptidase family C39 domain-containing protein [Bacteroidota bacterium]